ncbi:GNAT family N-acetyltransferase [Rhodococcus sp. PAE-6]|uniref:GNAT family N-acetyltransferase n=1 Tax=Rhodococcus sp. PAE-6 TaxID=2972477 RepID=UPI0034D965AB
MAEGIRLTINIGYATGTHLPVLRSLAQELLPELTELHGPAWDHRLGQGRVWTESLLLVAQDSEVPDLGPVGFCWVDPAMLSDEQIIEPWWCLNAIAVRHAYRGRKIGRSMVEAVCGAAAYAGAVSLYGVCDQSLSAWYSDQGFIVLGQGEAITADRPARRLGQRPGQFVLRDAEGECMFLMDIEPQPPARLCVPDHERPNRRRD